MQIRKPELFGTDIQIYYAQKIRNNAIKSWIDLTGPNKPSWLSSREYPVAQETLDLFNMLFTRMVETEASAAFWIDHEEALEWMPLAYRTLKSGKKVPTIILMIKKYRDK